MNLLAQVGDPLAIVAMAVTPVVMISATAILISGVNARYVSVSERVRSLAHEYRTVNPTTERRENIQQQMVVFHRRLELVLWAARLLYVAAGLFVSIALLIGISVWQRIFSLITLPIFIAGLTLVGIAIVLQSRELQMSQRTIMLESADVLGAGTSQSIESVESMDENRDLSPQ